MVTTLLLNILLSIGPSPVSAASMDSLRLEKIDGKTFIIHRVESKETLFAISRRYKVSVAGIQQANPGSESGIDAGKLLRIPYSGAFTSVSASRSVVSESQSESSGAVYHTVQPGETLFAISRQYKVAVSDIIRWNNLASSEVKAGQRLVVSRYSAEPKAVAEANREIPVETPKQPQTTSVKITPVSDNEKKETGAAILMEGSQESRKYLALHRTIPYGTIVRIRNRDTQQDIFVRIVGTPGDAESDVILRISKAAMTRLGGTDRIPVELFYFR